MQQLVGSLVLRLLVKILDFVVMSTEAPNMKERRNVSEIHWKTNAVMAGMFSMLRVDGQTGLSQGRDDGGGRTTPTMRSPLPARRAFNAISSGMNYASAKTRLPASMRKKKNDELHPILRRSVCTIVLATLSMVVGVILLLVDLLAYNAEASVRGYVFIGVGSLFIMIGLVWFKHSKSKLRVLREKTEEASKLRQQHLADRVNAAAKKMASMSSQHVVRWPTKKNCDSENHAEIQLTVTTPNGNLLTDSWSSSESDDVINLASSQRQCQPVSLPVQPAYRCENECCADVSPKRCRRSLPDPTLFSLQDRDRTESNSPLVREIDGNARGL
ncbi:uncharacterized protein LOC143468719 isoform X1 [Clavelina lepadiformis]|uniref:uncharacterized protein LOC143468719 isoform X1 n=2 Tax=Clavelina lepadiformis TaxID=159417 RepID=UPI0040410875